MTVRLHIPHARSLKDKRQVVKGIVDSVRRRFNVSVAEVDDLDLHQRATLGVACVSNEVGHLHQVLEAVRGAIERHGDAILTDVAVETF